MRASRRSYLTAFRAAFGLGVMIEVLQYLAGRPGSLIDSTHRMDYRDRLNLPITIPARTRATVRVTLDAVATAPQSRRMDLSRIADVMLFGQPDDGAGGFYLSRLWLE